MLPKAEQRLCTAVVILLDMSSSMSQDVKDRDGQRRPKSLIARDALERTIAYTERWKAKHPDQGLWLGLFRFSSSVEQVLPTSEFNAYTANWALKNLGPPSTGTAIGRALEEGFKDLYKSGCVRKHILCITDGFNSSGPPPDRIARSYYAETQGEVEIHFVAFDVSGRQFDFLKSVNGHAVEAADGQELESKLYEIYEKRIFAEAMPAEE